MTMIIINNNLTGRTTKFYIDGGREGEKKAQGTRARSRKEEGKKKKKKN